MRLSLDEIERRQIDPHWYCLQTKGARYDAVAASSVSSYGMDCLFPRIKKPVNSAYGKQYTQPTALFPGYVFAEFDLGYFRSLGYLNGVATIVGQGGEPERVSRAIIDEILARIGEDGLVKLDEPGASPALDFKPGDRVEIIDGRFKGMTGAFVVGLSANERVKVLLDAMYQSTIQPHVIFDRSQVARPHIH